MYNYLSIRDINVLFYIFVSANISLNKEMCTVTSVH